MHNIFGIDVPSQAFRTQTVLPTSFSWQMHFSSPNFLIWRLKNVSQYPIFVLLNESVLCTAVGHHDIPLLVHLCFSIVRNDLFCFHLLRYLSPLITLFSKRTADSSHTSGYFSAGFLLDRLASCSRPHRSSAGLLHCHTPGASF